MLIKQYKNYFFLIFQRLNFRESCFRMKKTIRGPENDGMKERK
jgi:hypothetical protein